MKKSAFVCTLMMVVLLPACGDDPSPEASNDLLFLRTAAGVALATTGASSAEYQPADSLPSGDWSTAVRARRSASPTGRGAVTRVVAADPLTGARLWTQIVDGSHRVKIVSADGSAVALGPTREPYYSNGRKTTKMVIVRRSMPVRTIELHGNYEPEAFSTDAATLFVIRYLPAGQPTRYQVRSLDVETGEVSGVYTVDAELQESMRGTARVQAMSDDGTRLYTLYTLREHGEEHTFVHVLSLDEKWAHCVDLPEGFADSVETATALTVSPDGSRLYVANAESGAIAEVDTGSLRVARTSRVSFGLGAPVHVATDAGRLFLASGRRLSSVALDSLREERSWVLEQKIRGLQVATDGFRLYVGQRDRIAVVDFVRGAILSTFDPPGVDKVELLGRTIRLEDEDPERARYVCAC